jgi:hypothetical protein
MKRIVLSLLFFSLMACEKTITYDLPTEEPQLAVTTRIHARDSIVALVSISSPVLNSKTEISNSATVILYENGGPVTQLSPINTGQSVDGVPLYVYYSSYDCEPGKTYTIRASQSNFESVEGTVAVPLNAPELSNVSRASGGEFREITVTITDTPDEENYYRIELQQVGGTGGDVYSQGFYTDDQTIEFYDGYDDEFIEDDREGAFGFRGYLRDRFFEGGSKKIVISHWSYIGESSPYYLKISSISKSSYDFERTIDLATYSEVSPFSEPVSVISNMSNGKGGITAEYSTRILFP